MNKAILSPSIIAGVIGGIIIAAFSFGTYYTSLASFTGFSIIVPFIPFMMVLLIIMGFNLRKRLGGFISFKEMLQFAMVAYLVYEIISAVVTYILFFVIDPQLTKKVFDTTMQTMANFMKSMGTPQKEIDKMLADSGKQNVATQSKNIFLGFGTSLIWDFVKSLLVAVIVKKERPIDMDFTPQTNAPTQTF